MDCVGDVQARATYFQRDWDGPGQIALGQSGHLAPKPDFAFEFDAVPTLLSGFHYQHALVPFHPIGHPKGDDAPSPAVWQCDAAETTHAPRADFLKVFYSTLASLALPHITKSGNSNFPNHHLCCYFSGMTNLPDSVCGKNLVTGETYTCDPPTWR